MRSQTRAPDKGTKTISKCSTSRNTVRSTPYGVCMYVQCTNIRRVIRAEISKRAARGIGCGRLIRKHMYVHTYILSTEHSVQSTIRTETTVPVLKIRRYRCFWAAV